MTSAMLFVVRRMRRVPSGPGSAKVGEPPASTTLQLTYALFRSNLSRKRGVDIVCQLPWERGGDAPVIRWRGRVQIHPSGRQQTMNRIFFGLISANSTFQIGLPAIKQYCSVGGGLFRFLVRVGGSVIQCKP